MSRFIYVELSDTKPWNVRLRSYHYLCKISKTFGVVVEVILKKGTVEVSISDRASRVLLVKKRGAIGPFRNKFETDFKERDDCLDRFHAPSYFPLSTTFLPLTLVIVTMHGIRTYATLSSFLFVVFGFSNGPGLAFLAGEEKR